MEAGNDAIPKIDVSWAVFLSFHGTNLMWINRNWNFKLKPLNISDHTKKVFECFINPMEKPVHSNHTQI